MRRLSLVLLSLLAPSAAQAQDLPTLLADFHQICTGQTVTFSTTSTIGPADRVTWRFPGGTPRAASGPGVKTVRYFTPGIFDATLTVADSTGMNPRTSRQDDFVLVATCSPITSDQGTWYFGKHAGLTFGSGRPVAVLDGRIDSKEPSVTQSDANGSLLFYANAFQVYDRNHALVNPGTPLTGHNSNAQGTLSVPDPGSSGRYYLFTLGPEDGNRTNLWYSVVDAEPQPLTLTQVNTPVPLPNGELLAEQLTVVPQCGEGGYWVIVHGGEGAADTFFVFSLTASGLSGPTPYAVARPGVAGNLKASPDGTMLVQCTQFFAPDLTAATALYDFDPLTGAITFRQTLAHGNFGCSFSPSSKLLYVSEAPNDFLGPGPIYQYDVTAPNPDATAVRVGAVASYSFLQLGPDHRIYIASYGSDGEGTGSLAVIFYPDRHATASQPNACGFSVHGPSLEGRRALLGLPNMINVRLPRPDFDVAVSACSQVAFHGPRCSTSFAWEFGDGGTSTLKDPVHTYAAPGIYTVRLTVTRGSDTSTVTKPVRVGRPPVLGPGGGCGPRLRPVG